MKAVIVEKPLSLWPMETLEIAEVSERTGCRVVVNTQLRFFPQYIAAATSFVRAASARSTSCAPAPGAAPWRWGRT